jgi:protein FAM32A
VRQSAFVLALPVLATPPPRAHAPLVADRSLTHPKQKEMSSSFLGGALKLKGDSAAIGKKKKKKSSSSKPKEAAAASADKPAADEPADEPAEASGGGGEAAAPSAPALPDRRTEAERRRDAQLAKLEEERLRKQAERGYRERVAEFNDKLAALSEHHDIPRVGPG